MIVFGLAPLHAGWLNITDLKTEFETVELGGERIVIHYNLDETGTTEASPAYVFVQFRRSAGEKWQLLDSVDLRGDGIGIINFSGKRRIVWWGTGAIAQEDVEKYEFRVRGMAMVRVPAGTFVMKSVPGRGYDTSGSARSTTELPLFYLAKFETTVGMYADFLNDTGGQGQGWNQRMVNAGRVGVLQSGEAPNHTYSVAEGRSEFPIAFVSWYDARSFLKWCGLKLPTEAEWEKGYRGGQYLDGDTTKSQINPLPERLYPWGDEAPTAGDIHRCNHQGRDDGFEGTAPVGSFPDFNGSYGAADQAGNVGEWTQDWYATTHHADLDGYRIVRGGSWRAIPTAVDAVSGATSLPLKGRSTIGFRGVLPGSPR